MDGKVSNEPYRRLPPLAPKPDEKKNNNSKTDEYARARLEQIQREIDGETGSYRPPSAAPSRIPVGRGDRPLPERNLRIVQPPQQRLPAPGPAPQPGRAPAAQPKRVPVGHDHKPAPKA